MSKFNIALVGGTGAVGQTVAAKLQSYLDKSADTDKPRIFIVGRPNSKSVEDLRNKGSITLTDNAGGTSSTTTTALSRDQVVESLHEVPNNIPKFPIFMTKGGKPMDEAVASMVDDAQNHEGKYIGAAVLQNGVGNAEKISATNIVAPGNLMYSTLNVASSLTGTGEVKQQNPNYKILLGSLSGTLSPVLQTVFDLLKNAGLKVEESKEIEKRMWIKLMWNTSFNAVAAIYNKTVGEIYADPELAESVERIMEEVRTVAGKKGIEIEQRKLQDEYQRANIDEWKSFRPSTLQDKLAGRRLEIDSIWQEVVNQATKYRIEVPLITKLLAELRKIDATLDA